MTAPAAHPEFQRANHLWYLEGLTHEAVALYRHLLQQSPNDAVVLFQLARSLWALDDTAGATGLYRQAQVSPSALSSFGRTMLERYADKVIGPSSWRYPSPLPIAMLDRKQLEAQRLEKSVWWAVENVATEREMMGVALYAQERGQADLATPEEAHDRWDLIKAAERQISWLSAMYDA